MSSSGTGEYPSTPAEQHLGDRLAALVDGELTGDGRDRVLAHLATCPQCKAAADEQRRLKSVVAASELPAISAGLMARLQGLPGMDGPGGPHDGSPAHGPRVREEEPARRRGPFDGGLLGAGSGAFGGGRRGFSYLTPASDLVAADLVGRDLMGVDGSPSRGFRVHEPSRGRRFAFAAAGAFSMAAIAIGSALPMEAAVDGGARPDEGPAVSPLSANSVSDTRGAVPRGMLESPGENTGRRSSAQGASGAEGLSPSAAAAATSSATSVSLRSGNTYVLH
ncbi:anti-sigma factor family protein [Actinacidiphila acididurans]|uniref:Zf-HC2 domain-containing protein n=1 Tax=Actinacidiphila acididurans TaxID=2784346 RepID=A0ABS2TXK8_9ACTN|nr:zf-HC2 domain-containing protein [Actinacidiphila acididurans]MBM9507706.1 zf-HC2 domain-containing protein [Actinacidiphila acididurans]